MLILLACAPQEIDEPIETFEVRVDQLPSVGWETVYVEFERTLTEHDGTSSTVEIEPAEPTVLDALGEEIAVEPVVWQGNEYGYAAVEGFEPGSYRVTHVGGRELELALFFEVQGHGQLPARFEEGAVFTLEEAWSPTAGATVEDQLRDLVHLEVGEVREEDLDFRVFVDGDAATCLFYEGVASVDANGRMLHEAESLEGELEARDLRLLAGLSPDGEELRGLEAEAVVDTRPLDEALFPPDEDTTLCYVVASFGVDCLPCPDGEERCLAVGIRHAVMDRTDHELPEEPPPCIDDVDDTPLGSLICSLAGALAPSALLAWIGLILARRRRR